MMIGYDRPLKPSWIYNCVKLVKVGDQISLYTSKFNNIIWQLHGTDGKRKVRTVLSRIYLRSENNPKSKIIEYTPVIELCKKRNLSEVKPLLLFFLLMRSDIIRFITKLIYEIYGYGNPINQKFLRRKIIEKLGERDISSRSLRNLLNTLIDFDLLENDGKKYSWKKKIQISEYDVCFMLKWYSEFYKKSPIINVDDIEKYLFLYYETPNFQNIGRKYNNILWEYSSRFRKNQILFHETYKWEI